MDINIKAVVILSLKGLVINMKKEKRKYPKEVIEAARVLLPYLEKGTYIIPKYLVFCTYNIHGPSPSTLRDIWNENANQKYLKPCLLFTSKRKRTCNARLKDVPDLKKWKAFLDMIKKDEWCLGIKPSPKFPNYIVNFDWFIRPGSIVKFLEGGFGQNNEVKADSNRENYGDELDRRSDYGGIK